MGNFGSTVTASVITLASLACRDVMQHGYAGRLGPVQRGALVERIMCTHGEAHVEE